MVIKKKNTVSILTITQLTRFNSIEILFEMIKKQNFKDIVEWVIVEGSQTIKYGNKNKILIKQFINNIKSDINFSINYIEYTGYKLGGLRNIGNNACIGSIIVCFDDDDYYPPTRIEEAVSKLSSSSCYIGGVSDVYLYDFYINKLFKFKGFMKYHSTNNCMAYKKEFLLLHKHDDNIQVGEERSFTREFTVPLVPFNSKKTVIAISHKNNTFNKRELCLGGVLKTLNTLEEINEPITNYIDEDIYNKMKKIYYEENKSSPYDIVYLLGYLSKKFHPNDNDLDENDRITVDLCNYFSSKGLKVAIYGYFDLENDYTHNNVKYIHWKKFPYNEKFNILIYGNISGLLNGLPFDINANKIYWNLYENINKNDILIDLYNKHKNKINKIFFKNNNYYKQFMIYLDIIDYVILQQPIINNICDDYNIRQRYRFLYDGICDNNLKVIITDIFSVIQKIEPRCELHIYCDMNNINDDEYKKNIILSFSENGITTHGKQLHDIIIREKNLSEFHILTLNDKIDYQKMNESIYYGCIPLIINNKDNKPNNKDNKTNNKDNKDELNKDNKNIKFTINDSNKKSIKNCALEILKLIRNDNKLNEIRNELNISNIQTIEEYSNIFYNNIINI